MSHRQSFGQAYRNGGGRVSPFTSQAALSKHSVSDLYTYMDGSTVEQYNQANNPIPVFEDDDAPDVVHIKFQGDTWTMGFPPFSIAEEKVLVKHVRDRVAERLGISDRRVRLVYKDRILRRNSVPLRAYGCKQNSEVGVIITQESYDHDRPARDSDSDSGSALSKNRSSDRDDDSRRHSHAHRRPRASSIRHGEKEESRSAHPSGRLHPDHASTPIRETREPRDPAYRAQQQNGSSHSGSHTGSPRHPSPGGRASPQSQNSPRSSVTSVQPPTQPTSSPLGKIQAMRYELHSKWIPDIETFLRNPPLDEDDRTKEYRKLSESVYARTWAIGDLIDPTEDEKNKDEIRALRKQTYAETQAAISRLDRFKPKED